MLGRNKTGGGNITEDDGETDTGIFACLQKAFSLSN